MKGNMNTGLYTHNKSEEFFAFVNDQHKWLRSLGVKPKLPCVLLTLLCIIRSSSLRWQLTLSSCCILASDAVRALFTSMNSCTVIGPSERSDDSELCG